MRISKLYMDTQDRTKFEIEGKSSVKYHLKANHVVEAKRWFWVLNNAIQWAKDEAKADEKKLQRTAEASRQARNAKSVDIANGNDGARFTGKGPTPAITVGVPLSATVSRTSLPESGIGAGEFPGENGGSGGGSHEPSLTDRDPTDSANATRTTMIQGDLDDEEEYGDDASDHEIQPASKDAFNITAHSASLQLSLLSQVSAALQSESRKDPAVAISHPAVAQAISTYETAVSSLQGLVNDLLKIARDRDTYWQYRLDREVDVRRLWEDSMTRIAKEQEELEGRIGESEDKRKRTKRALREALESASPAISPDGSRRLSQDHIQISESLEKMQAERDGALPRRKSIGIRDLGRRKSTIADLADISDFDSDEDEEFFDAVDAGEVEIVEEMPSSSPNELRTEVPEQPSDKDQREKKKADIVSSFKGYEDPVRTRLKMDSDDRPKISLWVNNLHIEYPIHAKRAS